MIFTKIKVWIIASLVIMSFAGTAMVFADTTTVLAKTIATVDDCSVRILTFPTWFRGLVKVVDNKCVIESPDEVGGVGPFIWHIVLNVIEIGLQLVGYITFFYILYGGFQFLTSTGDPSKAAKSRQTIINAVVGLAISFASIGIVNLVLTIIG
jgi:hypothetical protein